MKKKKIEFFGKIKHFLFKKKKKSKLLFLDGSRRSIVKYGNS